MKLIKLLLLLLVVLPTFLYAQRESVYMQIKSAAPLRPFTYYEPSEIEQKNGKINASLKSSNGYLFEITDIAERHLVCNKTLNHNQFKIVLIDNRMNKTYRSTHLSKGTLKIVCRARRTHEFVYEGEIFLNNKKVSVQANLSGRVRKLNDLKTN